MKRMKIALTLLMLVMLAAVPALSVAEGVSGSAAVTQGQTYTLEQMLTYAMQDEYAAQAEYNAIMAAYGQNAPFSNIVQAEATHITLLNTLLDTYKIPVPVNTAADSTVVPATLEEAYATGVTAENANIAMYAAFLAQTDLPDDVRATFTALQNASQSHLNAFTQNADKTGMGMRNGQSGNNQGQGRNRKDDGSTVQNGSNSSVCPMGDACLATGTRNNGQGRMGGGCANCAN